MCESVTHPENLERGRVYDFCFRSALEHGTDRFVVRGKFLKLVVGDSENQTEGGARRLKVVVLVSGEQYNRTISWCRMVEIIPADTEQAK